MARKKTDKPAPEEAPAPVPTPAPLPVVGTPPPASVFPDPATLLPQFQPATPAPAGKLPAAPTLARRVSGPPRRFDPTFDAPPQAVREARQRAETLRQTLGAAMRTLETAVRQVQTTRDYLAARPEAADQFAQLGVSMETALAFAAEAEDVLNLFKPVEA